MMVDLSIDLDACMRKAMREVQEEMRRLTPEAQLSLIMGQLERRIEMLETNVENLNLKQKLIHDEIIELRGELHGRDY
jgi:hypothetical protein